MIVVGGESRRELLRRLGAWCLPVLVMGACFVVLLPVATGSMAGGLASMALIAGVTSVGVVGFESTALGALALGVALSPMNNLRVVPFLSVSDLLLLLGVGCLVPVVLDRRWVLDSYFLIAVAGLSGTALISSLLASDPGASLSSALRLVVGAMLLPIVFMIWRPGARVVIVLAWAYVLGNVANFAAAFTQGVGDGGRRIGFSTHPNVLGLCAMLALGLAIVLWEVLPRTWGAVALLAAAPCLGAVWVSGSRAALLAAVGVLVLYPALSRSIVAAVILFGASLPVIFVAARSILDGESSSDNAFGRLLGGGSAQGSDQARELLADVAAEEFNRHPIFGSGLAAVLEAHNIYLQIAAAMGVIGVAFFVAMCASVVVRCLSVDRRFTMLLLPCFGYFMIGAITSVIWDRYIWCVLSLPFLLALRRDAEPEPSPSIQLHEPLKEPA